MMAVVGALVLDLDGTLIDSVPAVAQAINRILAEDGRPALTVEAIKGMIGEGAIQTIERALDATGGRDDGEAETFMKRYLTAYLADPASATVVYPDVIRVLEDFRAAGTVLGICTNKPGATTRPVLAALGLDHLFAAIVTADDTKYRKPDGRHVLETLDTMGRTTEGAFFVGDSETDIHAANAAKVPAVCVTYGYCHEPYADLQTIALIDGFADLPEALKAYQ